MKSFWTKTAIAVAALMCGAAAHAGFIDFESVDPTYAPNVPFMVDGDAVVQGKYFANTQDVGGGGGLIGQLSFGGDSTSCLNGSCPGGNATNFLSVFNDGIVHLGRLDGGLTSFSSLRAAYIPTPDNVPGSTVYLVIEADRANGYYAKYFPLLSTGDFSTIDLFSTGFKLGGTGSLTDYGTTDYFLYTYYCDAGTGGCTAFHTNKAQFAVDDISLNDVPEPASLALAVAGLAACGAATRRRRSV